MKNLPTMGVLLLITMVTTLVMQPHGAVASPTGFVGTSEGNGPGRHYGGSNEEHHNRWSSSTGDGGVYDGGLHYVGAGNGGSNHVGAGNGLSGRIIHKGPGMMPHGGHKRSNVHMQHPGSHPGLGGHPRGEKRGSLGGRMIHPGRVNGTTLRSNNWTGHRQAGNGKGHIAGGIFRRGSHRGRVNHAGLNRTTRADHGDRKMPHMGAGHGGSSVGAGNLTASGPAHPSNGGDQRGSSNIIGNPGGDTHDAGNYSGHTSGPAGQGGHGSAGSPVAPDCKRKGAICGDPKVVGGDDVVFYFYGRKDRDFCLVSDNDLHINAHFIGTRPPGRIRDNTWVQALGFVFGPHTLTIAAQRNIAHWDDQEDHLTFTYNGVALDLPTTTMSWASPDAAMTLTRAGVANSVDMAIKEKMEVSLTVIPVSRKANQVHKYAIPEDVDCFAHLDMQFKFYNLSASVNGVLGQTYRPEFVSPMNRSVAMPSMAGAWTKKFESSSLLATDCKASQYTASAIPMGSVPANFYTVCKSSGLPATVPGGITCHR